MAKDVKCKVNTCKHYSNGDLCQATSIEVSAETKKCGCPAETNCMTFKAK